MKVRVLYGSIVCITSILTILIFLDFRKQWKTAEDFRVEKVPLSVRPLFIAPEQINIKDWQVGEHSVYHLQTNRESKEISFSLAAQDDKEDNRFWLRTNGLLKFNKIEIEFWRLLDNTNLRPGSEQRSFYFSRNAIPLPLPPLKFPSTPVVIEKLGVEVMVTPIGTLECEHFFAYIRSSDGQLDPLLEMWTHPDARPLGIVRARWQDASLDLVEVTAKSVQEIPQVLLAEFDRKYSHRRLLRSVPYRRDRRKRSKIGIHNLAEWRGIESYRLVISPHPSRNRQTGEFDSYSIH